MENPFLKRLMKDETEDVVHSSAYAKAQNGEGIGAASAEGFQRRMEVDRNREYIRKYGESRVANAGYNRRVGGVSGAVSGSASGAPGVNSGASQMRQPPARRNPGISR